MKNLPNEQQRQVIDDLQNNIILFASAGTGKTFTVAARVSNLLTKGLAKAEEVLCLTFTIKAAKEMKEDIASYVEEDGKNVQVNTIHGFCYQLLLEESRRVRGRHSEVGVCDEVDQEEILRSILSSRLSEWEIEDILKKQNIVCPDLSACPIRKMKGEETLYWQVGRVLVGVDGQVLPLPEEEDIFSKVEAGCPDCGCIREFRDNRCVVCGKEISLTPAYRKFDIYKRKGALRNFVSEMKHLREKLGYYSEEEEEDYLRVFEYFKENDPTRYQDSISHYAQYVGYSPDEEYAKALEKYVGRWIREYDEHLRVSNVMDFDDLILKANEVLNSVDGYAYWSKKYKYIIVDEMQDVSALEYKVLKKLFADNYILLCGDFFQTIYGWRGSCPQEILNDYIYEFSAKTYMFSENYRATKTLANASFGYLRNTYPEWMGKYAPSSFTVHSEEEGEKIFCYAFDNREEEAWKIYKYLLRNPPKQPMDTCIIARSNKYIAELFRYFEAFNRERKEEKQLRFFTVEENFQFFKKPVVKDVLAVIKLLLNPNDRISMERLTEKFVRQVGIRSIESFRLHNDIGVSITAFLNAQTYAHGDPYYALLEGYTKDTLVVYDTETTGLDLERDEIVQLSAIKIDKEGKILDTLDILVEPTVSIEKEAYETHGFDLTYIRAHGGVTAKEALEEFSCFVNGCVLVGHNNFGYDKPLIERQLQENALPPLRLQAEYDTLLIAKQFYPQLTDYKLSTLCTLFSVVNNCAHNALGDITATGECLVRMIQERILPTAMERSVFLAKYTEKFEKFYAFMQEVQWRLENGDELAEYIIDRLLLKKRYESPTDHAAMRDLVESLQTDCTDRRAFLKEYVKDAALSGSQMDVLVQKLQKIPIITVHQAKGCEFHTVILAGADDNNFPSFAAKQSGDEEEEKKVFYVAITRAKERLILTRALRNGRYSIQETPYVWNIPEEYIVANRAWRNGE